MAIISCPECGGQISNKAENCIHCGCKIITCPECEAVYIKEVPVCTECGYAFQNKEKPVINTENKNEKEPEYKSIADASNRWKAQNESSGGCATGIILLILIAIIIISVIMWKNGALLWFNFISGYFVVVFSILGIGVCSLIDAIWGCFVYPKSKRPERFNLWAGTHKVDLRKLIKNDLKAERKYMTKDQYSNRIDLINLAILAEADSTNSNNSTWKTAREIIGFFISVISTSLFLWFAFCNITTYMFASDFKFSMLGNWWALAAAVMLSIADSLLDKTINTKSTIKSWIKQYMPEVSDDYNSLYDEYRKASKLSKKYGRDIEENKEE